MLLYVVLSISLVLLYGMIIKYKVKSRKSQGTVKSLWQSEIIEI